MAGIALTLATSACSDDVTSGKKTPGLSPELDFTYIVKENSRIGTRGLDSLYITQTYRDIPIFIELCCTPEGDEPVYEYGTYQVQSGYEGRLVSTDNEPLNWYDLESPHTFYGWTVPWDADYLPENTDPIPVVFQNSSNIDGYEEYGNNQVMEYLLGAKSDTYDYATHGKYVDLTFFHLVSKIKIGTLQLTETGSIQRNLKADVTFIGMPTVATLYPHPADGHPVVTYDEVDINKDTGVTYYIANDAVGSDYFYICPEVDFSTIDFQVKLQDEAYQDYNIYYGNFDAVEFIRTEDDGYDKADGSDDTVLHAGEMMTLNINLIPGVGPGLSLIISKWNTEEPEEASYHTHPGIYSDAEMSAVLDTFLNQGNPNNPTTEEQIQNLFDIYGQTDNGVNYFPMFDNVTITGDATIPIPEGYVLDGQGHTIFLNKTHSGVFGSDPYVNIGPCRNVYISNGTYTIYVDYDGNVWTLNADTQEYVPSGYSLTPLTGDEKSYDIDLITGQVKNSTYYNNYITN